MNKLRAQHAKTTTGLEQQITDLSQSKPTTPTTTHLLEDKISQLEEQLKVVPSLKAEIAVLKSSDSDTARLKEEAKEAHKLRLKVSELQAFEGEAELLKDELEDTKREFETLQSAHTAIVKERDTLAVEATIGKENNAHLLDAKEKIDVLTTQLQEEVQKNAPLANQLQELERKLQESVSEVDSAAHAAAISQYEEQISQQASQLQAETALVDTLRGEISALEESVVDTELLRDEINSLKSDAEATICIRRELKNLQQEFEVQQTVVAAAQEETAMVQRELEASVSKAEHNQQIAELTDKLKAMETSTQANPQPEIPDAAAEGPKDTDAVVELRSEVAGLKEQIKVIEAARAAEKQGYETNLTKYHDWHKTSQKTLDDVTATSEQRREQLEKQYQQLQEYHTKIVSQNETVKSLEEEAIKQRAKFQTKDKDLQTTRKLLLKANEEIEELKGCEENAKASEGESSNIISRLTTQLKEVTAQLQVERYKCEELTMHEDSRIDEEEREMAELLEKVRNAEAHAASVESEAYSKVDELEQRLLTRDEEIQTLTQRLCGLKSDEDARDSELHSVTQKLENLQSVLDHFVAERDADIEKATFKLLADLEKAHSATQKGEEALKAKEAETDELRKANNKELATRNSSITTLQNKLAQMRKLLDDAMYKTNEELMIEKEVATKLILQYVQVVRDRADVAEILTVMGSALNWTDEDKRQAGVFPQSTENSGTWWGRLTPQKSTAGPSLSDMWVNFLLTETNGGEKSPQKEDMSLKSEMASVKPQPSSTPPSTPPNQASKDPTPPSF
eukprot:TRINITY_DN8649_c0_g1_i1.p1 TRINITY_DN8649_c0_g1~~TRINITY_DN8649_c0_g1_i1.p1  ORF type:complete len:907 (+),score=317.50 TRINITY_DN8649_c0_g1_i1:331-2721(+)